MAIPVGKQYSARHKILFMSVPSYSLYGRAVPYYSVEHYGAILDSVFEMTDIQANGNGETVAVALWCVLEHVKKEENWKVLVSDQKTIAKMLED